MWVDQLPWHTTRIAATWRGFPLPSLSPYVWAPWNHLFPLTSTLFMQIMHLTLSSQSSTCHASGLLNYPSPSLFTSSALRMIQMCFPVSSYSLSFPFRHPLWFCKKENNLTKQLLIALWPCSHPSVLWQIQRVVMRMRWPGSTSSFFCPTSRCCL